MNKNAIFKWCDMKILLPFLFYVNNTIVLVSKFVKDLNKKKNSGVICFLSLNPNYQLIQKIYFLQSPL
jgi:hypothetical protein